MHKTITIILFLFILQSLTACSNDQEDAAYDAVDDFVEEHTDDDQDFADELDTGEGFAISREAKLDECDALVRLAQVLSSGYDPADPEALEKLKEAVLNDDGEEEGSLAKEVTIYAFEQIAQGIVGDEQLRAKVVKKCMAYPDVAFEDTSSAEWR